ncbi:MAG: flagellar hook-associated protein FlgK [Oligoflexia bacterium]|nr:flagellar hook-associated protein FlgK [Oligoflexia bacterium]
MANSVNLFNIGKSGLMVSKHSMKTTGHNIANVNSEGYSRQNVDQTSGPTIPSGRLTFGNGAWAKKVSRVNDEYLDKRIWLEQKNFSNVEEKDIYLQQTEQIFNESNNDGLNRLATRFFNEFRKLSTDTGNTAIRASVRESSKQLTSDIRRMDAELREVAKNIDTRVEGYVGELNALAREVRDLNLMIERAEMDGGEAPDLHDKRDLALKKLGAMADISTSRDKNGRITVTMSGIAPIVVGENVNELEVMRTPADEKTGKKEGRLDIYIKNPVSTKLTEAIKSGRLGGLLEVRDRDIVAAQDRINKIAYTMANEVNAIHRQGFGLDGASGRDFFKTPTRLEDAAESLSLSDTVESNLDSIAAAKDPSAQSDNRIAIAISGLGDLKGSMGDENSSILDSYNGLVSELAVKTAANKKSLVFQKDVLTQLENVRESLVGVNLDEETANLIQFQHAYAANAKVLQVADETLQTVLGTFR